MSCLSGVNVSFWESPDLHFTISPSHLMKKNACGKSMSWLGLTTGIQKCHTWDPESLLSSCAQRTVLILPVRWFDASWRSWGSTRSAPKRTFPRGISRSPSSRTGSGIRSCLYQIRSGPSTLHISVCPEGICT